MDIFEYESRKKINVTPIRIFASEDMKVTCDNSPVSLNCCSEINVNWSNVEWKQEGEITIPGKNVGCPFVAKEIWEMPWVGEEMSDGCFFLDFRL